VQRVKCGTDSLNWKDTTVTGSRQSFQMLTRTLSYF
jgi:hypothetical protein